MDSKRAAGGETIKGTAAPAGQKRQISQPSVTLFLSSEWSNSNFLDSTNQNHQINVVIDPSTKAGGGARLGRVFSRYLLSEIPCVMHGVFVSVVVETFLV